MVTCRRWCHPFHKGFGKLCTNRQLYHNKVLISANNGPNSLLTRFGCFWYDYSYQIISFLPTVFSGGHLTFILASLPTPGPTNSIWFSIFNVNRQLVSAAAVFTHSTKRKTIFLLIFLSSLSMHVLSLVRSLSPSQAMIKNQRYRREAAQSVTGTSRRASTSAICACKPSQVAISCGNVA